MSTCVIMQPTAFPWAGYFNLMARADRFVFLDDVQLVPRSWQTRNQILINGTKHWLSLNVRHVGVRQCIHSAQLLEPEQWKRKNLRSITQAYARHPHADAVREIVEAVQCIQTDQLSLFNQTFILYVAEKLGLQPAAFKSSELPTDGKRGDKILSICETLAVDEYLSPAGSAQYLAEDRFTEKTAIRLRFQDYTPSPYRQHGRSDFVSHLSIIDVVANLGWDQARQYVRGTET